MSSKAPQSYENHRQSHPFYHFFVAPIGLVALILASVRLVPAVAGGTFGVAELLPWLLALLAVLTGFLARRNALVAQDRAIRAEEALRFFILTGQRLDPRLTVRQIVALRFAADEEFPALAAKAAETGMKPDAIKKAVRTWRPDLDRV